MPDTAGKHAADPANDERQKLLAEIGRMTGSAAAGAWQDVRDSATSIRLQIEHLPLQQRHEALLAASAGFERVNTLATEARDAVGEELAAVRRGRKATDSYRATDVFRGHF